MGTQTFRAADRSRILGGIRDFIGVSSRASVDTPTARFVTLARKLSAAAVALIAAGTCSTAYANNWGCPVGQSLKMYVLTINVQPDWSGSFWVATNTMRECLNAQEKYGGSLETADQMFPSWESQLQTCDRAMNTYPGYGQEQDQPRNYEVHCPYSWDHQCLVFWDQNLSFSVGAFNYTHECTSQTLYFATVPAPDTSNLGECKTCPKSTVANPINAASGNKLQREVDYQGTGPFPLTFGRFYNAQDPRVTRFGRGWRHLLARGLRKDFGTMPTHSAASPDNTSLFSSAQDACVQGWPQIRARAIGLANTTATYANNTCTLSEGATARATLPIYPNPHGPGLNLTAIYADREDGGSDRFTVFGSTYTPDPGVTAQLEQTANGYRLTDKDVVEEYNSDGRLSSMRNRAGITQTFAYDAQGRLQSVTDSFSRSIQLTFDASDRFGTLTDPDGKVYTYAYNANNDISTVTYPDGKVRAYHYENTSFPRVLTGITDENNSRFATWTYDSMGRAKSSEHAGGAERVDITFNADGTATVKDALNTNRNYSFQKVNGTDKVVSLAEPCVGCGTSTASTTYDANGFVASRTDFNGNVTTYVNNARGLEESRTEAVGTPQERTITTQWHATYRLPTQIDEPGRRTVNTHDASGNRLTATVTDLATSESRTRTWSYNSLGQVLTVDGPRTDVSDVTSYTYGAQGNLATITNALGQVTQITHYDAHGNPTRILDPNNVETTLTYDLRQRLKTRTVAGASTLFDYDGVGQLTKVTLADGIFLSYTYDAAHRLTDIEDSAGNKIHYTLDLLGNRTKEEVFDPSSSLKRAQSQVFNALGRLQQIRNAGNQVVTEFDYDDQGNRVSQLDAGAYLTGSTYDVLNRLTQVTDAINGVTQYGYNALDQLSSVIDPKNLTTTYTLNALGDLKQQISPDSGETIYTHDAAGNRKTQTDARGVLVEYSYDALNRLTFVDYPGTAEDVTYSYDSTAVSNGKGRLTGVTDESGTLTLSYDARGNVTGESRVIGGTTYVTGYSHDSAGRLTSITYPTGRTVTYERANSLKQITKVTTTVGPTTTTLAEDITYMPFGGIKSYTLGNGVVVTRTYDQDYRLDEIKDQGSAVVQHLDLHYDLRSNIDTLTDLANPTRNQSFGYDSLSRLTSAVGGYGTQGFTYDGVGNRLSETGTPYTYPSTSHRLSSAGATGFTHDAAGNVTEKGALTLSYNSAHRLISATGGTSAVANTYGASGQRVKKTVDGITTVFHYDRQGNLLAETLDAGLTIQREYVWLDGLPLALASERKIPDLIVDNTDAAFSMTGAWSTASASGQYGSSYAKRGPAVEVPGESLVDDTDSGASFTGTWVASGSCSGLLCPPLLDSVVSSEAPYGSTYFRSGTSGTPVFTWQATLPGAGRYRVYVRWVPLTGAGAATYAVTHAGGTASHPVSQAVSSNGWYSLGSYEFGTTAQITLTPEPGIVAVADAVKVVPIEDTDSNVARWAAIGEDGTYEVYGRWPAVAGASNAAPFSIADAAGSTSLTQDQTAATGQWNLFGTYTFENPATQGISLGAVWDQTVLADAIHFVPVAEYAHRYNLAYFHVDHLGTPQKMTDAAQQIVWDAAYEPFGKATITAQPFFENPLRFPGQYEDKETGLYQNWHRDYDPSIGRYLQSDPVGLAGGINTYGYAGANPLSNIDPDGLLFIDPSGTIPDDASGPSRADNGPKSCEYYSQQCAGSCGNDKYACAAKKCCESFKDNYANRCTRACLIKRDKGECNALAGEARNQCRRKAHRDCYAQCGNIEEAIKSDFGKNPPPACQAAAEAMGGM